MNKPLLCWLGFHKPYCYLPKVGGDLGKTSIACQRCKYGKTYGGQWNMSPFLIEDIVKNQARLEYGRLLLDITTIQAAVDAIKASGSFTPEELASIEEELGKLRESDKKTKAVSAADFKD